jgi:hypothetical protein
MKRTSASYLGGLLLICAGILFLLQNFGLVTIVTGAIWALLFAVGGVAFLAVFATNQEHWWALIPGFTLLGLAGLIGLSTLFPQFGELGAALFFLAIALSFAIIYIMHRENWWAVIPAGVLTTLAIIIAFSGNDGNDGQWVPSVLFLGLAATFALVYFLPTPQGQMKWALWPAAVLGIMGLLMLLLVGSLANFIWPLALIAGGAALMLRTLRRRELK